MSFFQPLPAKKPPQHPTCGVPKPKPSASGFGLGAKKFPTERSFRRQAETERCWEFLSWYG